MSTIDIEHEQGEADAPVAHGESILDGIRELRDQKAREGQRTLDLDVPGYGVPSALVLRYTMPAQGYRAARKAVMTEASGKNDAELWGNADLLTAACVAVLARRDGKLLNLRTDEPVGEQEVPERAYGLNRELAEALRIPVTPEMERPSRYVARAIFSPAGPTEGRWDGDLALIGHGNQVYAFLVGAERAVDEDALGES